MSKELHVFIYTALEARYRHVLSSNGLHFVFEVYFCRC